MIVGVLDLGGRPAHVRTHTGQSLMASIVAGGATASYALSAASIKVDVDFWVTAWQALGGQAASSLPALRLLNGQLEEMAGDNGLEPVFVQFAATAQPSPIYPTRVHLRDGWYLIEAYSADFETYNGIGSMQAQMTMTRVAAAPPSRVAYAFSKANLATNFVGSAITPVQIIGFPVGSTTMFLATRATAEGSVAVEPSPVTNPRPFSLSATVANWWKGGVHVYDTLNTSSNPVPSAAGTFVHANWVEVFGSDHAYQGDCVITNGLLLLLVKSGTASYATLYLWSTALGGGAAWQQLGTFPLLCAGTSVPGTCTGYGLERLGMEETASRVSVVGVNTTDLVELAFRLQRASELLRIDMTSFALGYNATTTTGLVFAPSPATGKQIVYNSQHVVDTAVDTGVSLAAVTDYGFCGAFFPASGTPYVVGWLYQNQPTSGAQPQLGSFSVANDMLAGDGPALNGTTRLGFFALPFANIQNLQAEAESGTLGTGWSSVADAAASGGNAAKAASGTTSANRDIFGTSYVPTPGGYDVWFRVRVTSTAGNVAEMTLGLWDDAGAGSYVPNGSTTFKANQASTSYVWLRANTTSPLTPTAGDNMRFRAVTAATLGTDWFIDEAVLVPHVGASAVAAGPRDLFQQFLGDATIRQIRL